MRSLTEVTYRDQVMSLTEVSGGYLQRSGSITYRCQVRSLAEVR